MLRQDTFFSELIEHPNAKSIVEVLKRGISEYVSKGVVINIIQTDHCNIFAPNSGEKHKLFANAIKEANIEHRLIPFQMPEYNGKVERFHKVIDDESNLAVRGTSFVEASQNWKKVINYYNNERVTTRVIRCDKKSNKKYETIRFIATQRLEELKELPINKQI